MELSISQMDLFLNGARDRGRNIKDGWKDIYGEEGYQEAIDELYKVISDMQDVACGFMYYQEEVTKTLRTHIHSIKTA